jgi:hypothetical protein
MADASKHNWEFESCHPHNGEYWYKCSICGVSDWIGGYGTMDQLRPEECKPVEVKTEKPMETFIQPKITGYRQLSKEEAALMNEGKALAEKCGEYIEKLRQAGPCQIQGGPPGTLDQRWINIGATDIQKGFMALMRGIAQPTTF